LPAGEGEDPTVGRVEGKKAGTGFLPSFLRFQPECGRGVTEGENGRSQEGLRAGGGKRRKERDLRLFSA